MFEFCRKMFIALLSVCITSFDGSFASDSKGSIKCMPLNNKPYQARPTFVDINSDEILFYPCTVGVHKCGGSCNTINDPYSRVCVPNKVKKKECKSI